MTTYTVMAKHYDGPAQALATTYKRKHEAVRRMRQEAAILETFGHRHFETPEGEVKVVDAAQDRIATTLWVRRVA